MFNHEIVGFQLSFDEPFSNTFRFEYQTQCCIHLVGNSSFIEWLNIQALP